MYSGVLSPASSPSEPLGTKGRRGYGDGELSL